MISVIMPVFNEEKYLERAILSVLYQTFSDFEFIMVHKMTHLRLLKNFRKKINE